MARAQNASKGRFSKQAVEIAASGGGILFTGYSTSSDLITANSTGLVLAGGVKISNKANAYITGNATGVVFNAAVKISDKKYVSANSTGFIFTAATTKPATRTTAKWAFYTNSTGISGLMVNTTGTTWKFARMTATLNGTSGY